MKTELICFICLLLCVSCTVEQQAQVVSTGNGEWYTIQVVMPDNSEIVNAQLKTDQLILEFSRDRGIEKRILSFIFPIENLNEEVQFKGANEVNGLTFLHFTEEEKQVESKSRITKSPNSHEMLVVSRSGNRLLVHFLAENTLYGNLLSHKLREYYFDDADNHMGGNLKLSKGVLHFKFGKKYKGERSFPIHEFVEPHEVFKGGGGGGAFGNSRISWTYHYDIADK